jgi:hypothetical protein
MKVEELNTEKLRWIIATYDMMCLASVPDVPTLLFERWGFSENEVCEAIGLGTSQDLMQGLSDFLEQQFGICDLR